MGLIVGYAAAQLLARSKSLGSIGGNALRGYTVAFSILTLGASSLAGGDALIAVFLAGLAFNLRFAGDEQEHEEHIQEPVAKLFTLPMFVVFGLALPLDQWVAMGWPLAGAAVLVLLLRRPPISAAVSPALRSRLSASDVTYIGWFGPIGIGAIYYAALAWRTSGDPRIWYAASAIITASIVAHGLTAAPLTRLYARHPQPSPPGS
ncbi:MAG: cation:proton antiporter, partial [Vicinamibacterales bacterium]